MTSEADGHLRKAERNVALYAEHRSTLNRWSERPSPLEDVEEGITGPSLALLGRVAEHLARLKLSGFPAPIRLVPDGDGGVVMRWPHENERSDGLWGEWNFSPEGDI